MRTSSSFALTGLALFAAITPSLAQQQQQQGGNCTVFNWNQQPGYLINGTTKRVSGAASCPASSNATHACPILVQGDDDRPWYDNISSAVFPPNRYSDTFLHNLILNAVNSSLDGQAWPQYAIASVSTIQPLPAGTAGYVNFTAYDRCFEGTMSNCTGGVQDGLPIRACAAVVTGLGRGSSGAQQEVFGGEYAIQEIPEADVEKYSDPFAGQSTGAGAAGAVRPPSGGMVVALLALGMVVAAAM